ncbi:MAG: HD domain-containing protein [Christensenellaceae bacterium]|nr:HD domain-containing protein [Christensenellaceae bacterium]
MTEEKRLIFYEQPDFSGKNIEDLLGWLSIPLWNHSRRVAICSSIMAEYLEQWPHLLYDIPPHTDLAMIAHLGGLMHDVGKLLIPTLGSSETDYMRHPAIGAEFLQEHKGTLFDNETQADLAMDMVRSHHEQPNGKGFPNGLVSGNISLLAGICGLADALDHFLYREGGATADQQDVRSYVQNNAGVLFCNPAVAAFEQGWPSLLARYARWAQSAREISFL